MRWSFIIHFLSQENQSALHVASGKGQSGVVELLVQSRAQLDIQNKVYYTMKWSAIVQKPRRSEQSFSKA